MRGSLPDCNVPDSSEIRRTSLEKQFSGTEQHTLTLFFFKLKTLLFFSLLLTRGVPTTWDRENRVATIPILHMRNSTQELTSLYFCCCQVSSSPYVRVNLPSATLWHIIPLLLALLFRFFNSPRNATESKEVNELTAGAYAARGTSGNGRIQLMEKDLGSAVRTISQVVKAVEKLGVRFRVTRRTLRDPIREVSERKRRIRTMWETAQQFACMGLLLVVERLVSVKE